MDETENTAKDLDSGTGAESNVKDDNGSNDLAIKDKQELEPEQPIKCEDDGQPTLTKSQMKKLKKKEKWEQVKAQKRKAEKERQKARKRACIERGEEVGPTRKQLRKNKMSMSNCKVQVVVDCDFDQYMADKDIKMLVKQIQFSYSANRRAENPLQFHCFGISGKTKARLESLGDYKGWDIGFHTEGYLDRYDKASVVYLSSESPNVLTTLEDDKVYIIGGLVDHNHHKGLCHKLAVEKGVAHAQLPISDYIDMKTRKVLTINHVFEILLYYTETKDWQTSFYKVLPPRKGAIMKSDLASDKGDNSSKGEDSDNDCPKGDNTVDSNKDSTCTDRVSQSIPFRDNVDESGDSSKESNSEKLSADKEQSEKCESGTDQDTKNSEVLVDMDTLQQTQGSGQEKCVSEESEEVTSTDSLSK